MTKSLVNHPTKSVKPLTLEVLRRRVGLSQVQMSKIVRKTQGDISLWENGITKPTRRMGNRVLKALLDHSPPELKPLIEQLTREDLQICWDDVVVKFQSILTPEVAPREER